MRYLILLIVFLSSCATHPLPKDSTKGRSEDQHGKMMFYRSPEEIWPEDFKPAPQVCGSPFQGKIISK